jgi:hypothetical protein
MIIRRHYLVRFSGFVFVLGAALLALNLYGLGFSLRSPLVVQEPTDFSHERIIASDEAWAQLKSLDQNDRRNFALRASEIIGSAMKHERYGGGDFAPEVYAQYYMTVPAWENYFLYLFSFLKPSTYVSYELSGYRHALERGIGQCGQQAMTVIGFLEEHGFNTGFVQLNGHVVATAEVAPGEWYVLDPDYGVSIPHSIDELANSRALVETYYSRFLHRNPWRLYGTQQNEVTYGGAGMRYPRGSMIEEFAYIAKWGFPTALLFIAGLALIAVRRGEKRNLAAVTA